MLEADFRMIEGRHVAAVLLLVLACSYLRKLLANAAVNPRAATPREQSAPSRSGARNPPPREQWPPVVEPSPAARPAEKGVAGHSGRGVTVT